MNEMEKEIRSLDGNVVLKDNVIEGRAITFNSESKDLGGFIEVIHPEAVTQEFIDRQFVQALFNHDESRGILSVHRANDKNSPLKLEVRKDGLYYSFNSLDTQLSNEVREYIKAGIIGGSSFAMYVDSTDNDAQKFSRRADGRIQRDIYKIAIINDVSPVINPAYAATNCSCRSYNEFLKKEAEEAKIMAELDEYMGKINALD